MARGSRPDAVCARVQVVSTRSSAPFSARRSTASRDRPSSCRESPRQHARQRRRIAILLSPAVSAPMAPWTELGQLGIGSGHAPGECHAWRSFLIIRSSGMKTLESIRISRDSVSAGCPRRRGQSPAVRPRPLAHRREYSSIFSPDSTIRHQICACSGGDPDRRGTVSA